MVSKDDSDWEDEVISIEELSSDEEIGGKHEGSSSYIVLVVREKIPFEETSASYYCKFSITKQTPKNKVLELQRGNPRRLKPVVVIPTNWPEKIDSVLKSFFVEEREGSGWFPVRYYEIDVIRKARDESLEHCEKCIDNVEIFKENLKHHFKIARIRKETPEDNKKRKR